MRMVRSVALAGSVASRAMRRTPSINAYVRPWPFAWTLGRCSGPRPASIWVTCYSIADGPREAKSERSGWASLLKIAAAQETGGRMSKPKCVDARQILPEGLRELAEIGSLEDARNHLSQAMVGRRRTPRQAGGSSWAARSACGR